MTIDDFDKIWCLSSLDKERLENSREEFNRLGWNVEYYYNPINPIIKSCDKTPFKNKFYTKLTKVNDSDEIYEAVASCFVGHYNIIKISYELGFDKVLICEDDFYLLGEVDINSVFNQIPNDFDVLNFYHRFAGKHCELPIYAGQSDFWRKIEVPTKYCCLAMYAVSRKFMEWYLQYYNNYCSVSDAFFKDIDVSKYNCYVNTYAVYEERRHYSNICKKDRPW